MKTSEKDFKTYRKVSYKSLSEEEQQKITDLGFNIKDIPSGLMLKEYEINMSDKFFKWLEKCPVDYIWIKNNKHNCHYSFYFDEKK